MGRLMLRHARYLMQGIGFVPLPGSKESENGLE